MTEKASNVQQENHSRDFKGIWIPKEIWLDHRLTYFEKILLAEIHSLDGEEGCFASNKYFMDFFDERERKIQEGIAKLKSLGFIYVEKFDGRRRILRVNLETIYVKFSTSGVRKRTSEVRNSAPLGCQNPHPPSKDIPYREQSLGKKEKKQKKDPLTPASGGSAAGASRSFFLFEKIKENHPKAKEPNYQKWAKSIELMNRRDGYTYEEIDDLIEFATTHEFWRNNVLSADKLRKHALTMAGQMKSNTQSTPQREEKAEENRDYAKMMVQKNRHRWHTVYAHETGIEVIINTRPQTVRYTENGFKEKFHALLKEGGYT